jgi:hypothetical protein
MLGDIELRTVQHIESVERRALVEHRVPGMAGSIFQDLGRSAACIQITGILFGAEARSKLETLRQKFQAAEPISFTADIATATQIVDVLIADLRVMEAAGRPQTFVYDIILRESPPPPPPLDPLSGLNTDILGDAQGLFDEALGLADVLDQLGRIPNFCDPTIPLTNILSGVESAVEELGNLPSMLNDLFGES